MYHKEKRAFGDKPDALFLTGTNIFDGNEHFGRNEHTVPDSFRVQKSVYKVGRMSLI